MKIERIIDNNLVEIELSKLEIQMAHDEYVSKRSPEWVSFRVADYLIFEEEGQILPEPQRWAVDGLILNDQTVWERILKEVRDRARILDDLVEVEELVDESIVAAYTEYVNEEE